MQRGCQWCDVTGVCISSEFELPQCTQSSLSGITRNWQTFTYVCPPGAQDRSVCQPVSKEIYLDIYGDCYSGNYTTGVPPRRCLTQARVLIDFYDWVQLSTYKNLDDGLSHIIAAPNTSDALCQTAPMLTFDGDPFDHHLRAAVAKWTCSYDAEYSRSEFYFRATAAVDTYDEVFYNVMLEPGGITKFCLAMGPINSELRVQYFDSLEPYSASDFVFFTLLDNPHGDDIISAASVCTPFYIKNNTLIAARDGVGLELPYKETWPSANKGIMVGSLYLGHVGSTIR